MRQGSAGFTLLEVLMVMAVLGILASLAIPGFGYLAASTKVKGASTELYLAMVRARNEAVKRNRNVAVVADAAGWGMGWQIIADGDNDGAFNPADADDRVVVTQGELRRVTITMAATSVVFRSSGRASGAAPQFSVTSEDQDRKVDLQRCVQVDLTGRPYVKDGACI
ncbi:MAG: GspH/FimT family pseudopilin [Gammaproteobacteria bacterium]